MSLLKDEAFNKIALLEKINFGPSGLYWLKQKSNCYIVMLQNGYFDTNLHHCFRNEPRGGGSNFENLKKV